MFAIRHQYQVVRIEECVHGVLHGRLPVGEVQYCYNGQKRAQNASSQSNFDIKLL